MKKILYLLPVLALLISSCSNKNELTGTLSNSDNDGKQVFLLRLKDYDSSFEPADSVVIKNGKFTFKLEDTAEPNIAYLAIKNAAPNTPNGIPFVYENGNIEIVIDSGASKIKGTPMNEKCQVFFDKLSQSANQIQKLEGQIVSTDDETIREEYISQITDLNKELASTGYSFVKENIKNKVGEFYFISMMGFLSEDQIKELLNEVNPAFKKIVDDIRNINQPEDEQLGLDGKRYIDITGNTPEGKKIALSDYVGKNKLVLVDFWASWCGPCIKEMPNVVAAYNEFKSKGFEIVGISLDDNKNDWTKAIKNLNMAWPQMSDLKGWESKLSAPYQVSSIPYTILIDQEGNIVAENLRGADLHRILSELLK